VIGNGPADHRKTFRCRPSGRRLWPNVRWMLFAPHATAPRLLNLPELANQGFADVPVIRLPSICGACGSRRCRVIVSGR